MITLADQALEIICDPLFDPDFGAKFTCWEAEVLAAWMREGGYHKAAERFMESHSEDDDEGDDHYTEPNPKSPT